MQGARRSHTDDRTGRRRRVGPSPSHTTLSGRCTCPRAGISNSRARLRRKGPALGWAANRCCHPLQVRRSSRGGVHRPNDGPAGGSEVSVPQRAPDPDGIDYPLVRRTIHPGDRPGTTDARRRSGCHPLRWPPPVTCSSRTRDGAGGGGSEARQAGSDTRGALPMRRLDCWSSVIDDMAPRAPASRCSMRR